VAEDLLRAAVHEALVRVAEQAGADRIKAAGLADAEIGRLDQAFGGAEYWWPARAREERSHQIQLALLKGEDPKRIAKKHGVSDRTVRRKRAELPEPTTRPAAPAPRRDDPGLGSEDWLLR